MTFYLSSCKCLYRAPPNQKHELLYISKHVNFGHQKICGCRNYEVLVDLPTDIKQKYTFKKKVIICRQEETARKAGLTF